MIFEHPIYPITTDSDKQEVLLEQIRYFVDSGVSVAQLRAKRLRSDEFFEVAKKALVIAESGETKILINDRVDIAIAANADGVHVGQTDLPPTEVRALVGEAKLLGYSTHNHQQFLEALSLPLDYIALGPIFQTSSKDNPDPVVGTDTLKVCVEEAKGIEVVAIGGVNAKNLSRVQETGASAVASISAVRVDTDSIQGLNAIWSNV